VSYKTEQIMSDYEVLSLWQDVIEDAINGKVDDLKCPCGEDKPVEAQVDEYRVRVQCTECGKWVEGVMPF